MSQHDTLTLEQALRELLATGGVIAEASDEDLQAAIDDPHAEEIIKAQAAAILKARAALSATQPAQAAQGEPVAFVHWPLSGAPKLVWYSNKALEAAILKAHEHPADLKLYASTASAWR